MAPSILKAKFSAPKDQDAWRHFIVECGDQILFSFGTILSVFMFIFRVKNADSLWKN